MPQPCAIYQEQSNRRVHFMFIVAKKQLIAECMFCNFNTKALFYAKYFDIF